MYLLTKYNETVVVYWEVVGLPTYLFGTHSARVTDHEVLKLMYDSQVSLVKSFTAMVQGEISLSVSSLTTPTFVLLPLLPLRFIFSSRTL